VVGILANHSSSPKAGGQGLAHVPHRRARPARASFGSDLLPALADQLLEPFLSSPNPRRVVLGDNLRGVPENRGHVLDGCAVEKEFDSTRVAEAMRMSILNVPEFEESSKMAGPLETAERMFFPVQK
jgi:hypothetical protein